MTYTADAIILSFLTRITTLDEDVTSPARSWPPMWIPLRSLSVSEERDAAPTGNGDGDVRSPVASSVTMQIDIVSTYIGVSVAACKIQRAWRRYRNVKILAGMRLVLNEAIKRMKVCRKELEDATLGLQDVKERVATATNMLEEEYALASAEVAPSLVEVQDAEKINQSVLEAANSELDAILERWRTVCLFRCCAPDGTECIIPTLMHIVRRHVQKAKCSSPKVR